MKTKSAMQELIEIIYSEPIDNLNGHYLILKAKELLEKEKENIINAYNSGWQYGFLANGDNQSKTQSSKEYFNETFKHEQHEFSRKNTRKSVCRAKETKRIRKEIYIRSRY